MAKPIPGFDYKAQKTTELLRRDWVARAQKVIADGGRIRVEHGETYLHGANARIEAEIYGYIGIKSRTADTDGG